MGEVHYGLDHVPASDAEAKGFQLLADGINLIGFVNRRRLRRKHWHRVAMWVRWSGRRSLEIADVAIVEDRSYRLDDDDG